MTVSGELLARNFECSGTPCYFTEERMHFSVHAPKTLVKLFTSFFSQFQTPSKIISNHIKLGFAHFYVFLDCAAVYAAY